MERRKRIINMLLGLVAFALLIAIVASILKPMSFNTTVTQREKVVIERMKIVRTAAARYRQDNDEVFCSSIDSLVIRGYLADSLKYIPFSDGKVFYYETAVIQTKSGDDVSVMECRAYYDDYLQDQPKGYIDDLKNEATNSGRFPGLKFGDLTMASNNTGNWE
ncbi:MAG: hypothetical protein MR924_08790 [Prevotella sp.]|nr:hypothetical protein [Prevotella sp.]